ncbi:U16-lycotoxin-Ls1a isoform X2 [Cephus cinctus]|uniref:U16-lycotoxin-Ls1a isoform X2 n=1 Tax=Cephus cinctus TaxID=211228 RepID=A0AAJ7BRQ7_CEPCN|nr:U16-lycotoxin-Ls1a isoform X2 [Cephus cinctus]
MKIGLLGLICILLIVGERVLGSPYFDDEEEGLPVDSDYSENALEHLMRAAQQKRACVPRGGNCDHRPNDCCYNSSCRCNLWGSNCRCQRMGLFQKWG